jgi:hypothetical protein
MPHCSAFPSQLKRFIPIVGTSFCQFLFTSMMLLAVKCAIWSVIKFYNRFLCAFQLLHDGFRRDSARAERYCKDQLHRLPRPYKCHSGTSFSISLLDALQFFGIKIGLDYKLSFMSSDG